MKLENTGYFKLIGTDNKKISATNSFREGWETILKVYIQDQWEWRFRQIK